jgi:hypothetical protein
MNCGIIAPVYNNRMYVKQSFMTGIDAIVAGFTRQPEWGGGGQVDELMNAADVNHPLRACCRPPPRLPFRIKTAGIPKNGSINANPQSQYDEAIYAILTVLVWQSPPATATQR